MSQRAWRSRHPVAFFFIGEVAGYLLVGTGGGISDAAANHIPPSQPADGIGAVLIAVGGVLTTGFLIWGLVKLWRHLRGNAQGATSAPRPARAPRAPKAPRAPEAPRAAGEAAAGRKPPRPRAPKRAAGGPARNGAAKDGSRPAGAGRAPRSRAEAPADRRVKVLMLGDSGSGKTTMLASLYYRFAVGGADGIRFTTDDASHRTLQRLVARIWDPGQALFTAGTRPAETRTWEFGVKVESGPRERIAFTLEYLDYPGGYVERRFHDADEDPADPRFEQALAGADVLMGVLDGEKISKLMRGAYDVRAILAIENLLNILARARQRNIHLVVTKWDLLRGPGGAFCSITEVRDMLERESSAFRSFWESSRFGSVRIIPVSALGVNGFVQPDPAAGGGMAKVPGKPWEPWNVQVPFFCAIPDIIAHDVKKLSGKSAGNVAGMTAAALGAIGVKMNFSLGFVTVDVPVTEIVARVRRYARLAGEPDQTTPALTDNAAIGYLLNRCFTQADEFDRRFPDSRVRRPGANA